MTIITMLMNLNDNDGLTLKKGEPITYKTGWQVADYGMETSDINEAVEAVAQLEGSCGVWFSNGIYYMPIFRTCHGQTSSCSGCESLQR